MNEVYVPWSPLYEIGVSRIDEQHRGLAALISEFHAALGAGKAREQVFPVLNRLVRYVEEHFRDEEALMEAGHYPELLRQRREHEKLTLEIFALAERSQRGDAEITEEVMEFLKSWLVDHILHQDKKLEGFFRDRGVPAGWAKGL
ncbi:MAG: hemerythrin family protein [Deltaproteobacteria bacterium]|nr:hemerythrin family protein [Deltaproteobacteria bacterium]